MKVLEGCLVPLNKVEISEFVAILIGVDSTSLNCCYFVLVLPYLGFIVCSACFDGPSTFINVLQ